MAAKYSWMIVDIAGTFGGIQFCWGKISASKNITDSRLKMSENCQRALINIPSVGGWKFEINCQDSSSLTCIPSQTGTLLEIH